jgi:hypothetical protein
MWNQEQQIIKSEISSSEQLLWFGRPRQGLIFRSSDIWGIPLTLLYLCFLAALSHHLWSTASEEFIDLYIIVLAGVFIIFGLYLVIGRFFVDLLQRKKISYGITNERIVIVSGVFSQETNFVNLEGLAEIDIVEDSNGFGTIIFGRDKMDDSYNKWLWEEDRIPVIRAPKFRDIPNAKNVHEIIRNAQKLLR